MNQLLYNIFNPMENFFLEGFVCWVMSVHNRNMKQARAIEFDYTNLLPVIINNDVNPIKIIFSDFKLYTWRSG